MLNTPRRGDRFQHRDGWRVSVLKVKYYVQGELPVHPDFVREVCFIYESSGKYTEMPFSWFSEAYHKITSAPAYNSGEWVFNGDDYTLSARHSKEIPRKEILIEEDKTHSPDHYSHFL